MANINHFDFKNYRVFETEIAGRKLTAPAWFATARPLFSLPLPHPLSRVTASTFSRSPLTLRSVCTQ